MALLRPFLNVSINRKKPWSNRKGADSSWASVRAKCYFWIFVIVWWVVLKLRLLISAMSNLPEGMNQGLQLRLPWVVCWSRFQIQCLLARLHTINSQPGLYTCFSILGFKCTLGFKARLLSSFVWFSSRPLLLDNVASIQQSAALALGRLANYRWSWGAGATHGEKCSVKITTDPCWPCFVFCLL